MMKKIFVIVLAVTLLAAAVGVGIHILHRDARAEEIQFTCYLKDRNGNPVNSENIELHIHFWDGAHQPIGEAGAMEFVSLTVGYTWTEDVNSQYVSWDIEIAWGATPVNPPFSPHEMSIETHTLEWTVDVEP